MDHRGNLRYDLLIQVVIYKSPFMKSPFHFLRIGFAVVLIPWIASIAQASPSLLTWASFSNASDLSGLGGTLENGNPANIFGGVGSGLAWAGGNSFVMSPDRGPNAVPWNSSLDNTTSYISRLQNVTMELNQSSPGMFSLNPVLTGTTLLYSTSPLNYGATSTITGGNYYFNGRSDNFGVGNSLNSNNARFDPEAVRISSDGRYAYVSDEYGPYVYQFDRETGARIKSFVLPDNLGVTNLSSQGAVEIANNTSGRVANKGMEGLAISPDGTTLFGFMQGPLLQDTNGGGYYNRIVKIDIATGRTWEYAFDNRVGGTNNSSELLAINDHDLLVLERDSKGLGDGSSAVVKNLIKIDLTGATDVTNLSGSSALASNAVTGTVFLNIVSALNSAGIASSNIPAKLEGLAWGQDVVINGTNTHTLYMANDNDFVTNSAGASKVFVFGVTDADLGGSSFANQSISFQLGGDLYIGSNSTVAPVSFTSGTNFYNNVYVGYDASASNNQLLIANAGTIITNAAAFYVGYSGSGNSLTISNGGRVIVSGLSNNWLAIGENDGANSNSLTVTGSNSSLYVNGWLEVGWGSNSANRMVIAQGGSVSDSNGFIGYTNGSDRNNALITGTNSTWSNTENFYVGYSGASNSLIISNGGKLLDQNGSIGYHEDGNTALVTCTNSLWSNAANFYVGNCGSYAQLIVSNGGGVISSNGYIAAVSKWSNCSAVITGRGSYWSNSGTLTLGSVANRGNNPSSGNSLLIADGGHVTDSNAVIANATNFYSNSVTVTGAGSLWSNTGTLTIGAVGARNSLIISNGGIVVSQLGFIGASNTSTGNTVLITGTGSLWSNSGTLTIGDHGSGSITLADGGRIAASQIMIGANGGLSGTGAVNGSVVSSGNITLSGTFTVNGNVSLLNSSSFVVSTDGTSNSSVNVSGSASIGGKLVVAPSQGAALSYGQQIVFLSASSITGSFSSVEVPDGFRGRVKVVGDPQLEVIMAPASYTQLAQSQNQLYVATALNSFIPYTSGDQLTVSTTLDSLTASQYNQAFNAIMPTFYQQVATVAFNQANAQNMELNQRLWGVRVAEGGGFSMSGLADNYAMLQEGIGDGSGSTDGKGVLDSKKDILRPGLNNHWGMFVDGNGIFAQANSANMLPGYNSESGGVTTGLTYKWNKNVASGIYAGYQGTYTKSGANGSGLGTGSSLTDNAVRFGVFGTYGQENGKGFYANALAGGAYHNIQATRVIQYSGMDRTANSAPGAGELDTMLATGYDLQKGRFTYGPTASLQYTYLGVNSVNENGAQSLNFNSGGWNSSSMLSSVGAHAAYNWQAGRNIVVVPQISLNWQHEFMQNPYAISGNLGGTSPTFSNWSATPIRDFLYTGVGFTVEFAKKWNTSFFYNAAAGNSDLVSQNIFWSAGVKF
jgi:T5SS/PEP-CTERM-associated repeat protein